MFPHSFLPSKLHLKAHVVYFIATHSLHHSFFSLVCFFSSGVFFRSLEFFFLMLHRKNSFSSHKNSMKYWKKKLLLQFSRQKNPFSSLFYSIRSSFSPRRQKAAILKIFIVCFSLLIILSESPARLAKKHYRPLQTQLFVRFRLLHGDNLLHFNAFCFIDYSIVFVEQQKA